MNVKQWFWIGANDAAKAAVQAALGSAPVSSPISAATSGDTILVDARTTPAELHGTPFPHAFAAVRGLKDKRGVAVFVVVPSGDRIGVQLARFCLADGVLTFDAASGSLDTHELGVGARGPRRVAVDALLAKLEPQLGGSGSETSLQRLLRFEREDTLLNRLQDPETGLFDGPYATLKLDEEWKRAHRFHQPLSLLLLDLGPAATQRSAAEQRALFAEASGVFLNECRDIDVLARFAPTIFLVLLPGTGPDGAEVLARRILAALQSRLAAFELQPACGLCSVPSGDVPDRRAFLAIAEDCLRRAAAGGTGGLCASWQ